MKARAIGLALLASTLMTACNDEDSKTSNAEAPKSSSRIAKDLYDFEPAPPPPPVPPPPPAPALSPPPQLVYVPPPAPPPEPPPVVFEDPAPLLRAQRARELRAQRQQSASDYQPSGPPTGHPAPLDVNWRLK